MSLRTYFQSANDNFKTIKPSILKKIQKCVKNPIPLTNRVETSLKSIEFGSQTKQDYLLQQQSQTLSPHIPLITNKGADQKDQIDFNMLLEKNTARPETNRMNINSLHNNLSYSQSISSIREIQESYPHLSPKADFRVRKMLSSGNGFFKQKNQNVPCAGNSYRSDENYIIDGQLVNQQKIQFNNANFQKKLLDLIPLKTDRFILPLNSQEQSVRGAPKSRQLMCINEELDMGDIVQEKLHKYTPLTISHQYRTLNQKNKLISLQQLQQQFHSDYFDEEACRENLPKFGFFPIKNMESIIQGNQQLQPDQTQCSWQQRRVKKRVIKSMEIQKKMIDIKKQKQIDDQECVTFQNSLIQKLQSQNRNIIFSLPSKVDEVQKSQAKYIQKKYGHGTQLQNIQKSDIIQ